MKTNMFQKAVDHLLFGVELMNPRMIDYGCTAVCLLTPEAAEWDWHAEWINGFLGHTPSWFKWGVLPPIEWPDQEEDCPF